MRHRPFISRSTLIMLVALAGLVVAMQPGLVLRRFGLTVYLTVVALAALALVAAVLYRPRG